MSATIRLVKSLRQNTSGRWLLAVAVIAIAMALTLVGLAQSSGSAISTDISQDQYEANVPLAVSLDPNPVFAGDTMVIEATCTGYASVPNRRNAFVKFGAESAIAIPKLSWNDNGFDYALRVSPSTAAGQYRVVVRCADAPAPPALRAPDTYTVDVQFQSPPEPVPTSTTSTTSTTATSSTSTTSTTSTTIERALVDGK